MRRRLACCLLLAACRGEPSPAADAGAAPAAAAARASDSAFAEVQRHGRDVMGVDQTVSTHVFEDLPDGGRIVYTANAAGDTATASAIRRHLREVATAFAAGDFSQPARVHSREVPGTAVMAARRSALSYDMRDRPDGGEIRIVTRDPAALAAVRDFLQFQRNDHRAAEHEGHAGAMDHAAHMRATGAKTP